jgi:hypothetical protein
MIPQSPAATQAHIEFEHALRARLREYSEYICEQIFKGNLAPELLHTFRINYKFEHGTYDTSAGRWSINTWGANMPDITTSGVVFIEVVEAHIRRVREQTTLNELPALLPAPDTQSHGTSEVGLTQPQ